MMEEATHVGLSLKIAVRRRIVLPYSGAQQVSSLSLSYVWSLSVVIPPISSGRLDRRRFLLSLSMTENSSRGIYVCIYIPLRATWHLDNLKKRRFPHEDAISAHHDRRRLLISVEDVLLTLRGVLTGNTPAAVSLCSLSVLFQPTSRSPPRRGLQAETTSSSSSASSSSTRPTPTTTNIHVSKSPAAPPAPSPSSSSSVSTSFYKTKMCRFLLQGRCKHGAACQFAHSSSEMREPPNLTKTRLCRAFRDGRCDLGDSCVFAHGLAELRGTQEFFKTQICVFWDAGHCK